MGISANDRLLNYDILRFDESDRIADTQIHMLPRAASRQRNCEQAADEQRSGAWLGDGVGHGDAFRAICQFIIESYLPVVIKAVGRNSGTRYG